MRLLNRSRGDSQAEASQSAEFRFRCQIVVPPQQVANFSYPRTDFVHLYRRGQPAGWGSLGSESSPPPMVEDHDSDISAEEDCQYRVTGTDLWESFWRSGDRDVRKPEYAALLKPSIPAQENGLPRVPELAPRNPQTTHGPSSGSGKGSQASRPVIVPSPGQQRPQTPKAPPKACYSLFPTADVPVRRVPVPPRSSSLRRQPGQEPRRALHPGRSSTTRSAKSEAKISAPLRSPAPTCGPGSSRTTTPASVQSSSMAASSSDSIPLLFGSPPSSPPASPSATSSSSEAPSPPSMRSRKCSPALPSPRTLSSSRHTSRSSPSLASLAKSHGQAKARAPQRAVKIPAHLYDRPLPPLPTERPPSPPPQISVFETDSDDEDDEESGSSGGNETRSFARRFMHGLMHPHGKRRKDYGLPDHKRSVSDEGPSTATTSSASPTGRGNNGGSRSRFASRHRRGAAGAGAEEPRAFSMDVPRDCDGRHYRQLSGESEKGLRLWMGQQSSELLFGRLLRRRG